MRLADRRQPYILRPAFARWVIPAAQRCVQPDLHTANQSVHTDSWEQDARRAAAEVDRPPSGIVLIKARHTLQGAAMPPQTLGITSAQKRRRGRFEPEPCDLFLGQPAPR